MGCVCTKPKGTRTSEVHGNPLLAKPKPEKSVLATKTGSNLNLGEIVDLPNRPSNFGHLPIFNTEASEDRVSAPKAETTEPEIRRQNQKPALE